MKTKFGLQAIRRVNDSGHHYFISSLQDKGVNNWVTLGTKAKAAALFNPMTGECGEAKVRQAGEQTQVYLQLKSGESVILQTYQQPLQAARPWKYIQEQPFSLSLDMAGNYTSGRKRTGDKGYVRHRPPLLMDRHRPSGSQD